MTAAQAPAAIAYCLKCGREAAIVGPSLDPRYPIVRCSFRGEDGTEAGHGQIVGTLDGAAVTEALHRAHVERVTAHHRAHALAGRAHPDCRDCQANPPIARVTPHAFAKFPKKYRTAAHLEFMHGDRAMLAHLVNRSPVELELHHRSLHDAAAAPK